MPLSCRHFFRAFTLILFLTIYLTSAAAALKIKDGDRQRFAAKEILLTEMSGLASSYLYENRFWAHNDSGDRGRLFSFDDKGNTVTQLLIDGSSAFDWEDMSSFKDSSGAYLLIGDIGDNMMLRPFADVYLVSEPENVSKAIVHSNILRHYPLVYEDGPHDAEALAVDAAERLVYILTKRDSHPRLYRFSLDAIASKTIPLTYMGEVRSIPSVEKHTAQRQGGISGGSPTAMEFSPKGDMALIVTLRNTYYFRREKNDSWLEALNKNAFAITKNRMHQTEAATFTADGEKVLIGSEGRPAILELFDTPQH
ncbi:hypothetical protein [Zhongshania sp.]|jgi:hypothetical protein|uniref:hypothetical protein n=1 Tax=Zhongshania sp. TaxID=1971902 RepID=UPI0039E407E2